jgi:hypothetical protein
MRLLPCQQLRQNTGAVLGHAVEGDRQQLMFGIDTVGEAMNDAEICAFVEKAIYDEIIPVLDLPRAFCPASSCGRIRVRYLVMPLRAIDSS